MTWLLFAIVLVALITVACLSMRKRETSSPTFISNPQNDKIIVVDGWDEAEIQKIIHDFVATYKDDGYPAYTIEPHKQAEKRFRLTFPQDIHPLLFTFLVNFVAYPFDLDLKNRTILVGGKTTLDAGFNGVDSTLFGKKAILYVPENDRDYDVVYMQTESATNFANSFKSSEWKPVNDPRLPNGVKNLIASE